MPSTPIANAFLLVGAACAIVLTLAALVIAYFLARAAIEIHRVARAVREEIASLVRLRRLMRRRVRFAGKWARLFSRRLSNQRTEDGL